MVGGAVALDSFGDGTLLQTAFMKPRLSDCRNRGRVKRVEIMTCVKRENIPPCQFRGIGNSMTDGAESIDFDDYDGNYGNPAFVQIGAPRTVSGTLSLAF